jgi:hypothetical protein
MSYDPQKKRDEVKTSLFAFAYEDADASFDLSLREVTDDLKAEGIDLDEAISALRERVLLSLGKQRSAEELMRIKSDCPHLQEIQAEADRIFSPKE